ncbi:MAG: TIR domain-containing protein [Chlorobium sp.]
MADIFVSYAREDKERVRPIVEELEKLDWSVFWDTRLLPGDDWRSYIKNQLDVSSCVLVFWSRISRDAKWVLLEADEAKERGILVPVLLDAVKPPFGFNDIHAADLSDWTNNSSDPNFQLCIDAIKSRITKPEQPVPEQSEAEHPASSQKNPEIPPKPVRLPPSLPKLLKVWAIALTLVIMLIQAGSMIVRSKSESVVESPSSVSAQKTFKIGDEYGGGRIAYILQSDDPGYVEGEQHLLIAAKADMTGHSSDADEGYFNFTDAKQACRDLVEDGYSDWYLPDKEELKKINLHKSVIGGFAAYFDEYWSSTEFSADLAWFQNFNDGSQSPNYKTSHYRVRAVRAI